MWGRTLGESCEENYRMFRKEAKRVRRGESVNQVNSKGEDGRLISGETEVCESWKQYFESLLNASEERRAEITAWSEIILTVFEKVYQSITRDTFEKHLKKTGIAAGFYGVATEYLKM